MMNNLGEDGDSDIYRISPNGGFPKAIIANPGYDDGRVVVSPFLD